jgi:hypothetical protein
MQESEESVFLTGLFTLLMFQHLGFEIEYDLLGNVGRLVSDPFQFLNDGIYG